MFWFRHVWVVTCDTTLSTLLMYPIMCLVHSLMLLPAVVQSMFQSIKLKQSRRVTGLSNPILSVSQVAHVSDCRMAAAGPQNDLICQGRPGADFLGVPELNRFLVFQQYSLQSGFVEMASHNKSSLWLPIFILRDNPVEHWTSVSGHPSFPCSHQNITEFENMSLYLFFPHAIVQSCGISIITINIIEKTKIITSG